MAALLKSYQIVRKLFIAKMIEKCFAMSLILAVAKFVATMFMKCAMKDASQMRGGSLGKSFTILLLTFC
tara:strand:- start:948 stop:1154 length:207 start_codon:yes stop_codon:yes gene_type:complete